MTTYVVGRANIHFPGSEGGARDFFKRKISWKRDELKNYKASGDDISVSALSYDVISPSAMSEVQSTMIGYKSDREKTKKTA